MFSVPESASLLGVNDARVRALIAAGELEALRVGGRWIVTRASLEDRNRRRAGAQAGFRRRHITANGRPFHPSTAWRLMLAVDAGTLGGDLNAQERQRLQKHLGHAAIDVATLRRRAVVRRYEAHPSVLSAMLDDRRIVRTGVSAAAEYGVDLVVDEHLDAYVPEADAEAVASDYELLAASARPNVVLRVVSCAWPFAESARVAPRVAVGVDLLDSTDPRERRAGERMQIPMFVPKYFELHLRRGRWLVGQWSDGGHDQIRPEALARAIELGTDVRYQARMLRSGDVPALVERLPTRRGRS